MDSVYTKRGIITMVLFAVNIAKLAVLFYNLRVCLKTACFKMCVALCGRFVPDEGGVVGYAN